MLRLLGIKEEARLEQEQGDFPWRAETQKRRERRRHGDEPADEV